MSQEKDNKDPRFVGVNPHRLVDNPLEAAFLNAWAGRNRCSGGTITTFERIMDPPQSNPQQQTRLVAEVSDHDWTVAATVMQWLGSPVGQRLIIDVLSTPAADHVREDIYRETRQRRRKDEAVER